MEIKVLEQEKNRLKFELASRTHTLANAVAKELWNDKDIEVAGYTLEHPLVKNSAVMIVETSGSDPKKAVLNAISRLKKTNKEFMSNFKKASK